MRDPVKFLQTTSDKLDSLPVENGRIVVLKDTPGLYYEVDEKRYSAFKLDESDIATDEDVLVAMTELNVVAPIADTNNKIYTSNDGKVFTL